MTDSHEPCAIGKFVFASEGMCMGDGFSKSQASPETPGYLEQLPTAAHSHSVEVLEHLRYGVRSGAKPGEPRLGTEYLLFACADAPCAVPLKALREVRLSLPQVVLLPFSPDWLIGIFPLRTQLLALVDPAPLLLGRATTQVGSWQQSERTHSSLYRRRVSAPLVNSFFPTTALLVGEGEGVLALAVAAVGDIVLIPDEQIFSPSTAPIPIPEKYVSGIYLPSSGDQRTMILDMQQVLADLLLGLVEKEGSNG